MNAVQAAVQEVLAETRMTGHQQDPEWLAVCAMNLVQSRVRTWREDERVADGAGFTQWPPAILALGSGYCGGHVVAWRAILKELGIRTRQIQFAYDGVGHVAAEAWWDNRWHFFDVQAGTFWRNNGEILSWGSVKKLGDVEGRFRVSNELWVLYGGYHEPFASNPFAYLKARDIEMVEDASPARIAAVGSRVGPTRAADNITVTAALVWFDEPLDQLDACIRALPTVADRVVAVDGGYARYPGAAIRSPEDQEHTIREACEQAGLECVIHIPDRLWAGQVEKRSFLLQKTVEGTDPARDWFMAVDADHIWHGPRYSIRWELRSASPNVDAFEVDMFTPMNHDRPLEESAAGDWHANHADKLMSPQRLFRSFPGMLCERYHWWYSGLKRGTRVWLWGGDNSRPKAAVRKLEAPMLVEHRCLFREPKQIIRNREFCEDRVGIVKRTGQEDAV